MIARRWLMDEWRDTFVVQSRLHNVPGDRIGEALAEIDTHCADSGQGPDEAFGDPVDYARTLARDLPPAGSTGARRLSWTDTLMGWPSLGGVVCLLEGVDAAVHASRAALTVGQLITVAAGGAVIAVIATTILRPGRRDFTWRLAAATAIGIALTMFPQLIWKYPVIRTNGWALLAVGLLLLALAWWPRAANRLLADRIVDPRTGSEPFHTPRLLVAAIRWSLPIALLGAVIITVLLPHP